LILCGVDNTFSTHTGVFPACDRVTRIDMAAVGVVGGALFQGCWRKEPQQQGTSTQTRMKDTQKPFDPESHPRHFAIAVDNQWHKVWK
jgi:hypothetical protein